MFLDNAFELTITLKSGTRQVIWLVEAPNAAVARDMAEREAPKVFAQGWRVSGVKEIGSVKILTADPRLSNKR